MATVRRAGASALMLAMICSSALPKPSSAADTAASGAAADFGAASIEEITVTTQRQGLLGTAASASEGIVADPELQLAPIYRPGQLLETVPGLIVTSHSGEGKANQYLLRGNNLDHGTDLQTDADGTPVNQPTHAHGQGYTDLNFLIPELVDEINYTKGPYYANVGDFGAVGSVRLKYRDTIADEVSATAGTLGFQRILATGSQILGSGNLLAALELQHYDGPFVTPDDARKENAVLRYSQGDQHEGYSVTGMYYHQIWTNTTDIPIRAIAEGLVPNRFGTLDPTDGGHAQRASLSANYFSALGDGQLSVNGFFVHNDLDMFNNFTHFLVDPIHGDQEDQFENRHTMGGAANYTRPLLLGPYGNQISVGGYARYDQLSVGRSPSEDQVPLPPQDDPPSFSNHDQVRLFATAAYLQASTQWTPAFRSVLGLRIDHQRGNDVDYLAALHETAGYTNGGTAAQTLFQPKGSLIYKPNDVFEFYGSAGRGFHSADLRGVNQDMSVDLGLTHTPLLSRSEGQEAGVRAAMNQKLAATFAVFNLWQQSETTLNPDVGQDIAGPPSRRSGYEINLTYQINPRLEFYGSYSGDHTRFTRPFDDGTGHEGTYITNAPVATGSVALYLTDIGPWSGGLAYRYLGNYPLSSGPCVDAAAVHDFPGIARSCANAPTALGQVNARGFGQLNLDVHYVLPSRWSFSLGLYNLLNSHAAAAEFWYVDRLQNEIGQYPQGGAGVHAHPLEPIMARFTLSARFGP